MADNKAPVVANPWQGLRRYTAARIALGRAGVSLPTGPQLDFQLAHARARDAVHLPLDAKGIAASLAGHGVETILLHSAAADRHIYLLRPDLGRRLDRVSRQILEALAAEHSVRAHADEVAADKTLNGRPVCYDVAFVVADGLSALAIHQNAAPFVDLMTRRLGADGWKVAPLAIVEQGRVAVGDEVGELLGAAMVVVLVGERPGLSSPDSMGIYLTYQPRIGLKDASRNCISNVRPAGLNYDAAAFKLHYLMSEARRRRLSGVQLKDDAEVPQNRLGSAGNFLIGKD